MSEHIAIIAEIGISHGGNMSLAHELILQAKSVGADIAKTQLYDVDKLFPDKRIIDTYGRNWYNEVKPTQLSKEQVFEFAECCREAEIEFLASAFDIERLGWLEEIGVQRHKVGSRANKDSELIDAMLATGKPTILSTDRPLPFRRNIQYLYCVPEYPTALSKLRMPHFGTYWDYQGFSDHTIGIEASMVAMARGAKIIEKHFCLERNDSNPDMVCSVEPNELRQLVQFARKCEEILG